MEFSTDFKAMMDGKIARDVISAKVEELAAELPGTTFGYIGNLEFPNIDDRLWMIFLPHPGRVGGYEDSVSLGETDELATVPLRWESFAKRARTLYNNGSRRK